MVRCSLDIRPPPGVGVPGRRQGYSELRIDSRNNIYYDFFVLIIFIDHSILLFMYLLYFCYVNLIIVYIYIYIHIYILYMLCLFIYYIYHHYYYNDVCSLFLTHGFKACRHTLPGRRPRDIEQRTARHDILEGTKGVPRKGV